MYKTRLDTCIEKIEDARMKVARAAEAYSRGGSLQALNRANRELADAHAYYRENYGLRVPLPDR